VNDEDLAKVNGAWVSPPDVAARFAESDRIISL
jgi:hypothetical protein